MKKQILSVDKPKKTEIVQQPNELSQAHFYGSSTSYKVIIFALFKTLQSPNKGRINFSAKDFCKHFDIFLNENIREGIEKAAKELAKSLVSVKTDEKFVVMPWFEKIEVAKNGDVCIKFNPSIAEFLDFKIGYSALELLEIGELQSFYALRYYALAKSKAGYKNGWFEYTEDELRQLFEIQNKYPRRNTFVEKIIKKPIEEINEKTSISISLESEKLDVGKYRWRFVCSSKKLLKKITRTESKSSKDEKSIVNAEKKAVAKLKQKHLERWQEIFDQEMKQPFLFGGRETQKTFAENKADSVLLEEFRAEV